MAYACAAAASVAIGYAIDQIWGDGCYTAEQFWWDAGLGAGGALAFKGLGIGYNAWRGWGAGLADDAVRAVAPHGHHPIPKFLSGNPRQALVPLAPAIHTAAGGFHSQLNTALRAAFGRGGGGVGGSRAEWAAFFAANPGSQRQAFDILLDVSRGFDAANGTSVTSGVWSNIINGAFTLFP